MTLFAMNAASTPAQMTTLATRLPRGRHPGAVPVPGALAVRGARRVACYVGPRQPLPRQMERWQATRRCVSRSLVDDIEGSPRCGPIRQDGSEVRDRRTGHGHGCLGPNPRRRTRISGTEGCSWEPARSPSPPRADSSPGRPELTEPCGLRTIENRAYRRAFRSRSV